MSKKIAYSWWLWALFAAASLAGILFSYHYFPRAFPLISLDLTMNRHEALENAKSLTSTLDIGPREYHQVASFEVDNETKNFIELEGGGKPVLDALLTDKIYAPYYWSVRHFEEHNPHEVSLYFSPDGKRYGFLEKIPENQEGLALSQDEARILAQEQTEKNWFKDFSVYTLVEASQEDKPNKRRDHTFVYERTDKMVGQAHYRLTLSVQGDRLTGVASSLHVPEGFKRRYEHMRSANKTLSLIALFFMALLYILCCGLGGFMYLYHRRMLNFKIPMIAASVIATLQFLNYLNSAPLAWFHYNTATSITNFFAQLLLLGIFQWGYLFCLLSFIFFVAEGLTRAAFAHHPQLWKSWNPTYAASWQILGRTLGGYLMIGFDMVFVISVYAFTSNYLGWWTPSEALINPNILATYFPWFSSLAQSAMAGCMEEALFRALPLASALLIGRYLKRPKLCLFIAFIAQAIIFGAAHANYPAQPAYARLLELIVPSAVFGLLYLVYGLIPAIVSHFVYDVVWFALPLFVTKAPGSFINQFMVILGGAFPLLVVIYAWLRTRTWRTLPEIAYNKAAMQDIKYEPPQPILEQKNVRFYLKEPNWLILLCAGILGVLFWFGATRFDHDGIQLPSDRTHIITTATTLFDKAQPTAQNWIPLAQVKTNQNNPQHLFIWRTQGKEVYHQLLGTYLVPAYWFVRFASFQGDIAERAEEYRWSFGIGQELVRMEHVLPEEKSGDRLTEPEASILSSNALQTYFNFDPEHVQKISSVSSKKPQRMDWTFTYHTLAPVELGAGGQTRTTTTIANKEISDIYRHVFVPETWLREFTHEKTVQAIVHLVSILLLILLFIIIASWALFAHGFLNIHYPTCIIVALCLLAKSTIQFFNLWPIFQSNFSTSQPYTTQVGNTILMVILQVVMNTALSTYLISLISGIRMHIVSSKKYIYHVLTGLSSGAIYSGVISLLERVGPTTQPLWPEYIYLGAYFPSLNMALMNATSFLTLASQAVLIFLGLDFFTRGWQRYKFMGSIICLLLGISLALSGAEAVTAIPWLFILGLIRGILLIVLYVYSFRFERIRIIWAVALLYIFNSIQQAIFSAWSGVALGSIGSIALIIAIASLWTWALQRQVKTTLS